jgi:endonuclease G, mitochondrial
LEQHAESLGKLMMLGCQCAATVFGDKAQARESWAAAGLFRGPIFDDGDAAYRFDSKVLLHFWKLVVWKGPAGLQSIALLGDQGQVFKRLTRGVPESAEAFVDDEELSRVSEFPSTVEEIERLTQLRFSDEVRGGDVHRGSAGPEAHWDFAIKP